MDNKRFSIRGLDFILKKSGLLILLLSISTLWMNCARSRENKKFTVLVNDFVEAYFRAHPVRATALGVHTYDHQLDDFSPEALEQEIEQLNSFLKRLNAIRIELLDEQNKIDLEILKNQISHQLLEYEDLRSWERNPLIYTRVIGNSIFYPIRRTFAPWETRLLSVLSRLKQIPRLVEQARRNLTNPSKIHTEAALEQNRGNINLIKGELARYLGYAPVLTDSLDFYSKQAVAALEEFSRFLRNDLLPLSEEDFRLGENAFTWKLQYTLQSNLSLEEILNQAESEYERIQDEIYQLAKMLHKRFFPKRSRLQSKGDPRQEILTDVVEKVNELFSPKDELLQTCKSLVEYARQFVEERDFISLPDENRLVVDWGPEYRSVGTVAYLDVAGPFESDPTAFFFVSPIPVYWTWPRTLAFLKEYNRPMLRILVMINTFPGQYVQLGYSRRFPSLIQNLFPNEGFVWGWALLAEHLMIKAGFLGYEPRVKLMHLKFYLNLIIKTFLDVKIHTGSITETEAVDMMVQEGYQREQEAQRRWEQICLWPTRAVTRFAGFQEMWDLYRQYKKRKGHLFNQKEFNEKVLSYGSPPVKYVRELLLSTE